MSYSSCSCFCLLDRNIQICGSRFRAVKIRLFEYKSLILTTGCSTWHLMAKNSLRIWELELWLSTKWMITTVPFSWAWWLYIICNLLYVFDWGKGWLTNHFLQLNEDKAEFIIFGNRHPEKELVENYGLWSFSIHGDFYLIPENVIMSHLCWYVFIGYLLIIESNIRC